MAFIANNVPNAAATRPAICFLPPCTTRATARLNPCPQLTTSRRQSVCLCTSGISKTVTELRELTAGDYYTFIEKEAGSDLVVVDFYTDWCGPCKLMYPELVLMQEELRNQGVQIVKLNCNRQNKSIGKALDIRAAPTFFLYKNGEKVASMTGAKLAELRALVRKHM